MVLRRLASSLLLLGLFGFSVAAEELALPAGVVNVALPGFGDTVGAVSDYGLANVQPVETIGEGTQGQEIRLVRTPRELRLFRFAKNRFETRFQVQLGQVDVVYFWLEAPLVHGQWSLTLSAISPDGARETIFTGSVRPAVIHFARSPAGGRLEFRISSVEQTFKLSKHFVFTVSPAYFSLWPEFRPVPYRSLRD
ncbi:MAG TPA: hypothetical protein VKJ47_11555 [Candidatus Binatia bacterium]|nr:hypothetical protein [Candidatus Binatia bacterium]